MLGVCGSVPEATIVGGNMCKMNNDGRSEVEWRICAADMPRMNIWGKLCQMTKHIVCCTDGICIVNGIYIYNRFFMLRGQLYRKAIIYAHPMYSASHDEHIMNLEFVSYSVLVCICECFIG